MMVPRAGAPRRRLVVVAAAAAAAVAGCGGQGDDEATTSRSAPSSAGTTTPTGSGPLALSVAGGQLRYDKSALASPAGKVTIVMDNPTPIPHDVAIEGNGVNARGETVNKGGTSTVTADLKPGTYTFYCSVPGHKQAGMKGTLTVE